MHYDFPSDPKLNLALWKLIQSFVRFILNRTRDWLDKWHSRRTSTAARHNLPELADTFEEPAPKPEKKGKRPKIKHGKKHTQHKKRRKKKHKGNSKRTDETN